MVFAGRAPLYGAAAGGELGTRRALHILKSEVDRVLALLGCESTAELGARHVRLARPLFGLDGGRPGDLREERDFLADQSIERLRR
jgi:hypothetical protein